MILTLVLSFILLLLPSCSDSPGGVTTDRDIFLITVADDFNESKNEGNRLETVVNDQAALIYQFMTLDENLHVFAYTAQKGGRYYSTHPVFRAVDSSGESIDMSSPDFDHFQYVESSAESTYDWSLDDVLESTVEELITDENDIIIFAYSGHGDEQGALITNANRDPYVTVDTGRIKECFKSLPGYKIFFLDSCYSGNFISESTIRTTDSFTTMEDRYKGMDYIGALKESSLKPREDYSSNMWIMASAGKKQKAWDKLSPVDSSFQNRYGAFTYYLLKALGYNMDRNEAGDGTGILTFYSIYDYIRKNFPSSEISVQTPRVSLRRLDVRLR